MKRSAAEIGRDLQGYVARRYPHSSKISMMSIPQPLVEEAAAALARAGGGGWRPIAEAPKDGTKFDAWVPDAFGGKRMIGLSFNRRGQLRQHGLLSPAELPRWPTYWRPLPAAPDAEGR